MRLLNDKELCVLRGLEVADEYPPTLEHYRVIAKAQYQLCIKDFVEWGEEKCHGHPNPKEKWGLWIEGMTRKTCPECWGTLKQLMEE